MPDGMLKENQISSVDVIRSLGPSPEQIKQSRGPEWKSELPDIRLQLDPNDPNYSLNLEAALRGRFGEKLNYERDPLGLYSAASNYTESLLKFWRTPERGSPEYNEQINERVLGIQLGGKLDVDESKLRLFVGKEFEKQEDSLKEELDRNLRLAIASNNRSLSETISFLEAFVPPKPFEANMQERRLLDSRQNIEALATYFDSKIPEKLIGRFRSFDSTTEQQIGLFNILCAAGGGMEGYYDAVAQAGGTLLSRSRFHASMVDFRAAYTNDNPGVTTHKLTPEQSVHIKDTLASKEIAEMQVEMLSQARRLILLNADVAQYNVDEQDGKEGLMRPDPGKIQTKIDDLNSKISDLRAQGKNDEAERLEKHTLSLEKTKRLNLEKHREFMRLVFGEVDKSKWVTWESPDTNKKINTPEEISTWYADSDSVNDREKWKSKMVALLLWKSNDGRAISDFLENATEDEILQAAKEVLEKAEGVRFDLNDKTKLSDFEFMAAKNAVESWTEKDKAFQKSGRLAWKFNYKDEIKGHKLPGYVRIYDSGGIYKAYDSINLKYYWRRWTSYKAGLKSATTFFGPASDSWRREVSRHSPDWLPSLDEINKNVKIKGLHNRFFDADPDHPDPAKRLWRARRLTGKDNLTEEELNSMIAGGKLKEPTIDKSVQEWLLSTGWTFESAYNVPIPMFLPKTFPISLDEQMANKETKETVDDLYAMGIMPKDIDWNVYNYESLDRLWVSMSMLTKFAHLYVDSYEEQRDSDFQKFFAEPGVQSIAEMAKRVYLAYRDRPEGYQPYILSIVPFMIAQHTASEVGLLSTDLGVVGKAKEEVIKKWNFKMAQWIRAATWTPEVILDDQQLYDNASADIKSMRNNIALMIMYYKHVFEKVGQAAYKSDQGRLQNYYKDQVSLYKGSLINEMSAEPGEAVFDFGLVTQKIQESFTDGEDAVKSLLFGERR